MPTGEPIYQYELINSLGTSVKLINYGATLTSFLLPDATGNLTEITLGFDTLEKYLNHPYYFGCTVGRVANRIRHDKALAARVVEPLSGRNLEVQTTQARLQFYSGNYLVQDKISNQRLLQPWSGLCLETHGYPNAVNHPHFPSIMLLPNDIYSHEIIYRVNQPG